MIKYYAIRNKETKEWFVSDISPIFSPNFKRTPLFAKYKDAKWKKDFVSNVSAYKFKTKIEEIKKASKVMEIVKIHMYVHKCKIKNKESKNGKK